MLAARYILRHQKASGRSLTHDAHTIFSRSYSPRQLDYLDHVPTRLDDASMSAKLVEDDHRTLRLKERGRHTTLTRPPEYTTQSLREAI